ncbi:cytochrome P450 [Rhodococcus sp. IEGM 1370]|uniref:cytochrome P450 n=1 Tax=Rhodococcus sp. IEGM 1370 TaxID=3082222 RepID=UPI0029551819|nr:cytochrome P450 [Rhodococcus sp. IEGM 1370]MDV8079746.1 cytochrome P450 [Rhodococcus sp. IEGM 1370]
MTSTVTRAPSSDFDPFSTEVLSDLHFHDGILREVAPVVDIEKYGFYAVTRHVDIQKALRDWRTFSSTDRPFYQPNPFRPVAPLMQDPPDHTQTKAVMLRIFSRENMAKMAAYFTETAENTVDALLARGPVSLDAYYDVAAQYVLKVFPDVLGLPTEGRELLLNFGDAVFNAFGPQNEHHFEKMRNGAPALEWVETNMKRELQAEGGIGWQLYTAADEGVISEAEAEQLLKAVLGAGFDTTIFGISGALRAFADNPDQWQLLRSRPELVEAAFEEALRLYPPSRFGGRVATKDTQLAGIEIPSGTKLLMMWLGAGRDPRKWPDPDTFRIDRDNPGGHLSFGFGIHTCAGQAVARLEAKSLLTALLNRVERIELDGEPRRALNFQAFGHDRIPVRLVPASR